MNDFRKLMLSQCLVLPVAWFAVANYVTAWPWTGSLTAVLLVLLLLFLVAAAASMVSRISQAKDGALKDGELERFMNYPERRFKNRRLSIYNRICWTLGILVIGACGWVFTAIALLFLYWLNVALSMMAVEVVDELRAKRESMS